MTPVTGLDEAVADSADVTFLPSLQVAICLYDYKDFIAQDCGRVSRGWQVIIFSANKLLQTEVLLRKEAFWLQTRGASSQPAPCAWGNGDSHSEFPKLILPAGFGPDLFGLSFTSEEWNNTTREQTYPFLGVIPAVLTKLQGYSMKSTLISFLFIATSVSNLLLTWFSFKSNGLRSRKSAAFRNHNSCSAAVFPKCMLSINCSCSCNSWDLSV